MEKKKKNRIEVKLRSKQGVGSGDPSQKGRKVLHYVRGQPRRPQRKVEKALTRSVYGCGREKAKEVCRACGLRESVEVGSLEGGQVQLMEQWMKENRVRGADRRRKENEAIQRQRQVGTVRGMKIRRGLPVRGQRTSTNGITARKLNRSRVK